MHLRPFNSEGDRGLVHGWMDELASRFLQPDWLHLDSPTNHRLTHALVGEVDETPVGVVLFHFYTDDEALVFMLVAPYARGRGLGQRLLRDALCATTAAICKADVDAANVASVACARAAGFVEMVPPEPFDMRFFVWTRDGRAYEPVWACR